MLEETHVPQHHDGREQEGGRVGLALASDIGGGTVDGLEDGGGISDVAGRCEAESTDEAGAEIRENITVEIRHDHDPIRVRCGVLDHAETDSVEEILVVLDVRELLRYDSARLQEHAIRHLHNGRLVHRGYMRAAAGLGVLEGVAGYTFRGLVGDELDGLDDARLHLVLDTRVLSLGVLADQNAVDVLVGGLEALNGLARADVGVEAECPSQCQVERDVSLANGRSERSLQCDRVLLDRLDR